MPNVLVHVYCFLGPTYLNCYNELDPEFAPSQFQMRSEGDGLQCPAGKVLVQIKTRLHHDQTYGVFEARQEHCAACQHRTRCLKKDESARRVERVCESDAMKVYLTRQQQPAIRELYRTRKAVAEFPQLRFKGNWGLRQFSVRGLAKVNREAIWIALAFNVSQWLRLRSIPRLATI
jgi:Transposase DDE domain